MPHFSRRIMGRIMGPLRLTVHTVPIHHSIMALRLPEVLPEAPPGEALLGVDPRDPGETGDLGCTLENMVPMALCRLK